MSFYVTLPSNAASNTNKDNTTTHYRTHFKDHIKLLSEYEVAIVEVIYNLSWFMPVGHLKYIYEDKPVEIITIIFHDGDSIRKCIEKINMSIQEHILIKYYNQRYNYYFAYDINAKKQKAENPSLKISELPENKYPRKPFNIDSGKNNLLVIHDIKSTENEF